VTLVEEFYCRKNRACGFATIHEQPFPLPQYFAIGDLPSAAAVAQTNFSTVLFGPLRKQSGPRLLSSNKEMEIAGCQWLRKTKSSVQPDEIVQLVLRWDK
jgi:hypothetical protein